MTSVKDEISILLVAFILLILGIIFAGVIADNVYDNTNTYTVTNETLTGVNGTAVTLTYDDLVEVTQVRNTTTQSVIFNETSDYTVTLSTGAITVLSGSDDYSVDYVYYPDNYVKNATSRSLINLLVIFFVIGVVGTGIWAATKNWGDMFGGKGGRL